MEIWKKYLEKLEVEKRKLVISVLKMVRQKVPEVEAALPYGVPGWKYKGKNLVAVAAHQNHLGVYPFSPEVVKKIKQKIPRVTTSEGTIRFGFETPPTAEEMGWIARLRKEEIILVK